MTKVSGDANVNTVLQRLNTLSQNEARRTTAEILRVVHGLLQVMSEYTHSTCLLLAVDFPSF